MTRFRGCYGVVTELDSLRSCIFCGGWEDGEGYTAWLSERCNRRGVGVCAAVPIVCVRVYRPANNAADEQIDDNGQILLACLSSGAGGISRPRHVRLVECEAAIQQVRCNGQ